MRIEDKALQHWMDHFYGYGSWKARIWYVSYEEGGGDLPEEVAEKLTYFSDQHASATHPVLCDVRELYKQVAFRVDGPRAEKFETLYDYRFGPMANPHGIWKNLVGFTHGYDNKPLPDVLAYQREEFAQASAQREALLVFYPLPSPHNHAWYYSWLDMPKFPFLKTRAGYQQHVYQQRIDTLLQGIKTYKPKVVLMYEMNNILALKKSIQTYFPKATFSSVKGVKLQIPQHHRADLEGTTLLLTTQVPALRHNRVETGFDWYALGQLAR